MKKLLTVSLAIMSFTLAACDSKTPSDDVASKAVMKYAQRDTNTLTDVEIVDFKRSNGWNDKDRPHQYDVSYDYNLRLTKPLAQAVLDEAKAIVQERQSSADDIHRQGATMEFLHSMDNMPADQAANAWLAAQGEKAKPRFREFTKDCPECVAFVKDTNNVTPFVLSWMAYENVRYPDNAQAGAKTSRQAWAGFTKTESGWMAVSDVGPSGNE